MIPPATFFEKRPATGPVAGRFAHEAKQIYTENQSQTAERARPRAGLLEASRTRACSLRSDKTPFRLCQRQRWRADLSLTLGFILGHKILITAVKDVQIAIAQIPDFRRQL